MYKKIIAIFTLLFSITATAQKYPVGYFRSPLDIPLFLAGNFGECRPNHFHSGIDIKTNGNENLPVYAVAEGYISRIKMESGGFGHAIYITHPNGFTSLYAHLNDFMPALQRHVRNEQYKNESWMIDLQFTPSQFPVKKGQQIAWSGNTGSSTAPHLHFEIRDNKTEHPLNPQLFGFEIKDNIPPLPTKVAVYNSSQSIYEQTAVITSLTKKGSIFYCDTIMCAFDKVGVGISVNDFMNGSENTLTFYRANIYLDSVLQGTITLDNIGYDVTRYQHAYIDYKTKKLSGQYVQLLFQLPGNLLNDIYSWKNTRGILDVTDHKVHKVDISLEDAATNTTHISFYLKGEQSVPTPDCTTKTLYANHVNHYENPNVILNMTNKALYDDVCLQLNSRKDAGSCSDWFMIHRNYVPVHTYYDLQLKPNKAVSFTDKDKIAMVYNDGKDDVGKAATADGAWYKASVRNMGEYRLVLDKTPPVIKCLSKEGAVLSKASQIRFVIKDEITSVKKYRAEIDGKWVCVEQHGDQFFYTFDEHCTKGKHKLVFTATDENNNTSTFTFNFTR